MEERRAHQVIPPRKAFGQNRPWAKKSAVTPRRSASRRAWSSATGLMSHPWTSSGTPADRAPAGHVDHDVPTTTGHVQKPQGLVPPSGAALPAQAQYVLPDPCCHPGEPVHSRKRFERLHSVALDPAPARP